MRSALPCVRNDSPTVSFFAAASIYLTSTSLSTVSYTHYNPATIMDGPVESTSDAVRRCEAKLTRLDIATPALKSKGGS